MLQRSSGSWLVDDSNDNNLNPVMFARARPRQFHLWRSMATAAAATTEAAAPVTSSTTARTTRPRLRTAIILNRSPLLTRTPTPFESAYYAYQARIQRALSNPFPYEFYFKPGQPLQTKFIADEAVREYESFGKPYGDEPPKQLARATSEAAAAEDAANGQLAGVTGSGGGEEADELVSRVHESDKIGDVRSLDRQGERNLYLLVKDAASGAWRFPRGSVQDKELLHEAADRDLKSECGERMDTWIVSRNPIGVHNPANAAPSHPITFFYKAHIFSGQVHPDGKKVNDFAWLTKQEIEAHVNGDYWITVKDMLSDF